ncbi:hypothetical protein Salat_0192400 [Sesamum alatum]|uniref:Uncharacterized protein n=1 Tax=Sesamum alatum TaxID=300844 RepID=A0AAE1YYD7_9LAMI|nr:hypothetical protein Salat_0192400 [Sesamum alatum]
MDKVLSLMDEEVADFIIPQATSDRGSGGFHLTLVSRLVSYRSIHFEALKGSLLQLIQAACGVSIRKISESQFSDPLRRLGPTMDGIRPTYMRHSRMEADSAIPRRRGGRIFGDFCSSASNADGVDVSFGTIRVGPSTVSERLHSLSQQLGARLERDKSVTLRFLVDVSSETANSDFCGHLGLGSPSGLPNFLHRSPFRGWARLFLIFFHLLNGSHSEAEGVCFGRIRKVDFHLSLAESLSSPMVLNKGGDLKEGELSADVVAEDAAEFVGGVRVMELEFEASWARLAECSELIFYAWAAGTNGDGACIVDYLAHCSEALSRWRATRF